MTIADQVELPAYGMLNARLQYNASGDKWSLAILGTNLTDEYWLIGGVGFGRGYTVGAEELDPGRPLEYGVELRVNF